MGEVLGVGITHYPPLLGKPETYANILRRTLRSPVVPEEMKDPKRWPAPMQEEYADELERAKEHQERHIAALRKVRKAIDAFRPDAVIIFGDDQYENFREDIIPPFNIFLMDEFPTQPFYRNRDNVWGLPPDTTITYRGHKGLAKYLATELIEQGFPMPYSFKNLHFEHGLSHAFANGLVYLDWDMKGFPYPVIPIAVNCYGKDVVPSRGGTGHLNPEVRKQPFGDELGPPGPTPRTCYQLGQMVRKIVEQRPERVVIMASSGWSHAFLVAKHHWLWPDVEADRVHLEQLRDGQHQKWAELTNEAIDDAGDQEFKNWICLAGAMEDRRAHVVDYLETYLFNSPKCFALFPASGV